MAFEITGKFKGVSVFLYLIFIGFGLFLLWRVGKTLNDIHQSKDWVEQEATLQWTRFNTYEGNDDDPTTYGNNVLYKYTIDGQSYKGDQIGFGYGKSNIERHHQIAEKIKYAKRIKIWINPNNPSESTITKGINESVLFTSFFALIWNCLFIGVLIGLASSKNNHSPHYGAYAFRGKGIMKWLSYLFISIAVATFILMIVRLVMAKKSDKYVIKLEDKIEVIEYKSEKEIRKAKEYETAMEEALSRLKGDGDTVRIRLNTVDTINLDWREIKKKSKNQ